MFPPNNCQLSQSNVTLPKDAAPDAGTSNLSILNIMFIYANIAHIDSQDEWDS